MWPPEASEVYEILHTVSPDLYIVSLGLMSFSVNKSFIKLEARIKVKLLFSDTIFLTSDTKDSKLGAFS